MTDFYDEIKVEFDAADARSYRAAKRVGCAFIAFCLASAALTMLAITLLALAIMEK